MCGRIAQHRSRHEYAQEIGWERAYPDRMWLGNRTCQYNLSPGVWPDLMHTLDNGNPEIDTIHWGYRPEWAVEKGYPPQINARVENAISKPFYRAL